MEDLPASHPLYGSEQSKSGFGICYQFAIKCPVSALRPQCFQGFAGFVSYSHSVVKRMIQHQQEECGWEFLFLGADIDAFAAAKNIGIRQGNAVRYRNREDIRDSYAAVSRAVSHVRFDLEKSAMLSENWKAELEEKVRRAEER